MQRLAHITPAELGGKAHQSQDVDNKLDQWLMYAMFVCSCPPVARESTKDLYHLIFPSLKSGSDVHVVREPQKMCEEEEKYLCNSNERERPLSLLYGQETFINSVGFEGNPLLFLNDSFLEDWFASLEPHRI